MSSSSIAPITTGVAPLPAQNDPVGARNASAPTTASQPAAPSGPATSVTISNSAKRAATASTQPAEAAASSTATVSQTTTSQYVAKVRAAPAQGGNRTVSEVMASLGVPQADQAQIAAVLSSTAKSA